MSRRARQQDKVFRAVVVYKKTEKNPEHIPDKYISPGNWERGNGLPFLLYLNEPDEDLQAVYGPYSRMGDARAAGNREAYKRGVLRENVYCVRHEVATLDWKEVKEE